MRLRPGTSREHWTLRNSDYCVFELISGSLAVGEKHHSSNPCPVLGRLILETEGYLSYLVCSMISYKYS